MGRMVRIAVVALALVVGLALPCGARPGAARWARLGPWAQQSITLRRTVRDLQRQGRLPRAHREVARRLSREVSKKLGRKVTIPARRIVQVTWGSPEHQLLRGALASTVGVGIYPSPRWGHNKLRVGQQVVDSVPGSARAFPSTGTRARMVEMNRMHHRYYEAVFAGSERSLGGLRAAARSLVEQRRGRGMGCASFVSNIVRQQLRQEKQQSGRTGFGGRLDVFSRGESAAGNLWRKAVGAQPALIVVYTPPGDHRTITHPGFTFDYAL